MRGINQKFVNSLQGGELAFFLQKVKDNPKNYALAIRNNYINIYYRGGNLLKITQKPNGYQMHFDKRYCIGTTQLTLYERLNSVDYYDIDFYINNFDSLQCAMDEWFALHRKIEREFQHKLLQSNSCIVDIEYQVSQHTSDGKIKSMRFDMLAVQGNKLLVIENKYGNGAIIGSAGLNKHYNDICSVLTNEQLHSELLQSVHNIATNKYALGLLNYQIPLLDKSKTEIVFVLANYNKASRALLVEVSKMHKQLPAKVLFINYIEDCKLHLEQAKDLF